MDILQQYQGYIHIVAVSFLYRFSVNSTSIRYVTLHFSNRRGAASLRSHCKWLKNKTACILFFVQTGSGFQSLSNKTMVAIFPNVCLWQRSYSQNLEVLTLKNCHSIDPPSVPVWPTLLHRMALVSFLLFRKNLGNLREFFLGKWFTAPPDKKLPVRLCTGQSELDSLSFLTFVTKTLIHSAVVRCLRNILSTF